MHLTSVKGRCVRSLVFGMLASVLVGAGVGSDPETAAGWINKSMDCYYSRNFQLCIQCAEAALRLDPKSAGAYNNICAANNALGHWESAEAAGEAAARLDPRSGLIINNLRIARRAHEQALQILTGNLLQQAIALNARGKGDACVDVILRILEIRERDSGALSLLAKVYCAQGKYEMALIAATNAIQIADSDRDAAHLLRVAQLGVESRQTYRFRCFMTFGALSWMIVCWLLMRDSAHRSSMPGTGATEVS